LKKLIAGTKMEQACAFKWNAEFSQDPLFVYTGVEISIYTNRKKGLGVAFYGR
jgi:hypothetical protein